MTLITIPPHLALITAGHIATSMELINEEIEHIVAGDPDSANAEGLADLMEEHEQANRLRNYIVHQIGGTESSIWMCVDDDCRWLNPGELELCESCGADTLGSL